MRYLLLFSFLLHISSISAQVTRCSTMEMTDAEKENLLKFEKSISQILDQKKSLNYENAHIINGVYTIPLVFHVIHNGESVGSGYNISYDRLLDQLKVLNDDFRKKTGTMGFNTHPSGADTKIEFCLAKRRPDGSAFPNGEDGVNRINRNSNSWSSLPYSQSYINSTVKPFTTTTQNYDATIYMNFWVIPMSGGLLGYAQFPEISVGGMACTTQTRTTDGVVMATGTVGGFTHFDASSPPFNKGRTATHEIGHWLGLRHIWGDANCGDDYCDDTPVHASANNNCPTHPKANACGTADEMFENYMDYSEDACLSIFTFDQAARMRATLETYRWGLVNSSACMPPASIDAGCVQIIAPVFDICSSNTTPIIRVKNYGTTTLTSITIESNIDGGTIVSKTFTGLNIVQNGFANLTLDPISGISNGQHTFAAQTTLPNGQPDSFTTYDQSDAKFTFSTGTLPIIENFEGPDFPTNYWGRENPDTDCWLWVADNRSGLIGASGTITTAAMLDCFSQSTSGTQDALITPSIDLTTSTSGLIEFDIAHRRRSSSSNERLQIQVSTDCGGTWQTTALYDKSGAILATNATTTSAHYVPAVSTDWRHEAISLDGFIGQSIKLRFLATNNNGNNIWLDNVKITDGRPTIEFVSDSSSTSESTITSIDCRGYKDISIALKISIAPTTDVIVTPTFSGTALDVYDYEILSSTITFPAGSTNNQNIQIRIYDDSNAENIESLVCNFTTTANALPGTIDSHELSIFDNEANPPSFATVLFAEDFESYAAGSPAGGWTIATKTSGTNNWVFGENGVISGNKSAYISQNTTSRPFTYSNNSTSRRRLVSPAINTTGKTGLKLNFDYICNGNDVSGTSVYDFGRLMYATDAAGPFNPIDGPADANNTATLTTAPFHQKSTSTNYSITLPTSCENLPALYLVWRWDNDNSVGSNPPLMIDNIVLTYEGPAEIETALSYQEVYISPKSTTYIISANNKLMAKIDNKGSADFGCTSVEIERFGNSTSEFYAAGAPNYLTEKAWIISPSNNISTDSLDLTLYFTATEKIGWENATGKSWADADIQQTGGSIANITVATPNANGNTNIELPATFANYGTGFAVTTTITNGFGNGNLTGGFAVGKPDTLQTIDRKLNSTILIYPNPNNGVFNLLSTNKINAKISIVNMEGKKVFEINHLDFVETEIHTHLPSGLYIIEIQSGNEIQRQKISILK